MSYYPIKCIYCMETIPMSERCVKLAPEEIRSENPLADHPVELSDDTISMVSSRGESSRKIVYKSLRQLREEGKVVKEEVLNIDISREFSEIPECNEDFVQYVEVKDLEINGKSRSGVMRKWYCPVCHNEIIPQAGKMPIYLISLMGPSSAGKTVYLTILHMLLSGRTFDLPSGYISADKLGRTGDEYQDFANGINNNILPGTTVEFRKDPYMLQVSYVLNRETNESCKRCLIGLIDMRGEMLQGGHNEDLEYNTVPQFKKADGFIMMVDPETLEGVYNKLPEQYLGARDRNQLQQIVSAMKEVISSYITSNIGRIDKPSIVALTKEDILYKYNAQLGIPLDQPVIAPMFKPQAGTNLAEVYYKPMHDSTQECIKYLSGSFTAFLHTIFKNPYFVSVSALGSEVVIDGNRLDNAAKISPVRVETPLMHLLMDFNFIPPFYREEYYHEPIALLNTWGEYFAEDWVPLEVPKEEEKKDKKLRFWHKKTDEEAKA